jgi:hypothetical protein
VLISSVGTYFSFQVNRQLPYYALSFANLIAQQSQTQISFQAVRYHFPASITFKGVQVLTVIGKRPVFKASRLTLGFFKIVVNNAVIDFPVFKDYLAYYGQRIHAWAKTLPKGHMRIYIPNGKFYPAGFSGGNPVAFKTDFILDQQNLSASGTWGNKEIFRYKLKGHTLESGFDLDQLTLDNSFSSVNLWGSWSYNDIRWKGFMFYQKSYILDIDGDLSVEDKNFVLKRLSFSVNGDAVGARGLCSKEKLFQCEADITYWRKPQQLDSRSPLKNIDLHFRTQNSLHGLLFTGTAGFNFIPDPRSTSPLQNLRVDFSGLKAGMVNGNSLKLNASHAQTLYSLGEHQYSIPFENLLAYLSFNGPYHKSLTISAGILQGQAHGRIFLDTGSKLWKMHGRLRISNAHFENSDLQLWMSQTLQMPSLSKVSGAEFSCRFSTDGRSKIVDDLKLANEDFDLRGFFHLDADDLVTSQGNVRFSQRLMDESGIGRRIISLVKEPMSLPFEFRLSGNLERMNFQWDTSPLKIKVRQHIFSFFQNMVDRRLDAHPRYNVTIPNESVSPG